jgi:hypothetical protein
MSLRDRKHKVEILNVRGLRSQNIKEIECEAVDLNHISQWQAVHRIYPSFILDQVIWNLW